MPEAKTEEKTVFEITKEDILNVSYDRGTRKHFFLLVDGNGNCFTVCESQVHYKKQSAE